MGWKLSPRNKFIMTTFQSLPNPVEGESVQERLLKLATWCRSLDGYLYSIGSALTELRKEIGEIRGKEKETAPNLP